jgi:hypothetical protein
MIRFSAPAALVALAAWLMPAAALAVDASVPPARPALAAPSKSTARLQPPVRIVKKKRVPKGYGFLPGYRPPPPRAVRERLAEMSEAMSEWRYLDYWGNWRYGYGWPGFYRGRWNGGSFGPCWTQTPIGPIWNCGR